MTARFSKVQKAILCRLSGEWSDVGERPMTLHGLQSLGLVEQRQENKKWQARLTKDGLDALGDRNAKTSHEG
jgi:hypothetical protein